MKHKLAAHQIPARALSAYLSAHYYMRNRPKKITFCHNFDMCILYTQTTTLTFCNGIYFGTDWHSVRLLVLCCCCWSTLTIHGNHMKQNKKKCVSVLSMCLYYVYQSLKHFAHIVNLHAGLNHKQIFSLNSSILHWTLTISIACELIFSKFSMHVVEKLAHKIEPNSAIVLLIVKSSRKQCKMQLLFVSINSQTELHVQFDVWTMRWQHCSCNRKKIKWKYTTFELIWFNGLHGEKIPVFEIYFWKYVEENELWE